MKDYSILIDILTNSMEIMSKDEFTHFPDLIELGLTTFVLNKMWLGYWELSGMQRFEFTDSDWNDFILGYIE